MSNRVVLVVEDEDAIRLSLRDYLEQHGHSVLVASDGVGAIQHLIDNTVDVIVTDYRMDLFGGDYWIRFLQRFCSGIPVYVISGYLPAEVDVPFPVVSKPFDYGQFERLIAGDNRTGQT